VQRNAAQQCRRRRSCAVSQLTTVRRSPTRCAIFWCRLRSAANANGSECV